MKSWLIGRDPDVGEVHGVTKIWTQLSNWTAATTKLNCRHASICSLNEDPLSRTTSFGILQLERHYSAAILRTIAVFQQFLYVLIYPGSLCSDVKSIHKCLKAQAFQFHSNRIQIQTLMLSNWDLGQVLNSLNLISKPGVQIVISECWRIWEWLNVIYKKVTTFFYISHNWYQFLSLSRFCNDCFHYFSVL